MPRRATLASCGALVVLLAAPAAAATAGPSLRARPDRLVLGPKASAVIEIEGAGASPPTVTVNVGRIERLRPAGAGRFVADYLPPPEQYPQVAIVAARAGDAWGWTALPLYGRGVAIARSSPHARIRVAIGDASFGPVTADATGEARVPVIAPPGTRFAYHRDQPLDLEVPPVVHVHLALGRPEAPADSAHDVPLRAFVVAPSGAARAGAPLRIVVSEGRLVELAETAPGSWAGTWRLEPGRAGLASATGTLADEPGPAAVVQLPRMAGAIARLSVQPAAARAAADEAVLLRVVAADAAGNPVDEAPVVEATLGELSRPVPVAPGTWETRLAVPPRIGAIRRVQLVARAGAVEGRAELGVAAGPAAALEVSADPAAALVADGAAAARLRVLLRDRFGNPADAAGPPEVAGGRGDIAAEPDGPGAWTIRYRPRRARENRTEILAVRSGGLASEAQLAIVAPERRLGLAPKVGLAASPAGLRAPYGAVEAAYRSRWLAGRLALALEVGRFVHERTDAARVGEVGLSVHGRARYLPALGTARWEARLRAHQLWAGVGGGLAHVRSEVSIDGGGAALEQGFVPVVHATAGWGLRMGHSGPFVEARVARHGDPGFETLRGSLTVIVGALGYRYDAY